jgi:hypothetical protein
MLAVLCLPGPKTFTLTLWIYCITGFFFAIQQNIKLGNVLKVLLVNIFACSFLLLPWFKPTIVTCSYVNSGAFLLSMNLIWTLPIIPKTIDRWELIVFFYTTIVLTVYPWCYAFIAIKRAYGTVVNPRGERRSYGVTQHGLVFMPTYRPIMIVTYSIWNISFVIMSSGNISGLFRCGMAIVTSLVLTYVEGRSMADFSLFWILCRGTTLGCWLTTLLLCNWSEGGSAKQSRKIFPTVDKSEYFVTILFIMELIFTFLGVFDLFLFYTAKKKTDNVENALNEFPIPRINSNSKE